MKTSLLVVPVFVLFGIIMVTTQGFANSLDTSSEINPIGTLKISDSSAKTLIGLNLGITNDISSVTLTFKNSITDNDTVNISFKNTDDVEIGNGSEIVSPTSSLVVISLMDPVTSVERTTLGTVNITIT